jgi:uncharacterized protein YjbJ (UPF0337 family)
LSREPDPVRETLRAEPMACHLHQDRFDSTPTRRDDMGEIIDKTKGRIKRTVGKLTGDEDLEQEGEIDELKGKLEGAVEDVKRTIKKAAK